MAEITGLVRGKGCTCEGPSGAEVELTLGVILGRAGEPAEAERVLGAMGALFEGSCMCLTTHNLCAGVFR